MRSMGFIQHAENPAIKLVLLVCKSSRVDFKSIGNCDFVIKPLFEHFYVKRTLLHFFLRGPKKKTTS